MDLIKLLNRDCVTASIQSVPAFEQHHAHEAASQHPRSPSQLERYILTTKYDDGVPGGTRGMHRKCREGRDENKNNKNDRLFHFETMRPNSLLYTVCAVQDPSIELTSSDSARVNQRVGALRDVVLHGVLHDADMCERYSLKPRTKKLQEFVQAVTASDLDDTMPEPFLEYIASRVLETQLVVITMRKAQGMPYVWSSSFVAADNSNRPLMVYCRDPDDRTYALASGESACVGLCVHALRTDVARLVAANGRASFDDMVKGMNDESTLVAWATALHRAAAVLRPMTSHTSISDDSVEDRVGAAIAESTAPKRSRAKKSMEARRSSLADGVCACMRQLASYR